MEGAARWGLAARGVIYVLVGLLALQIAAGDGGRSADQGGAVRQLAAQPFGRLLVWAVGIGLASMALWRLAEAVFGASGPNGRKPAKRLASGARFVVYTVLSFSVLSYAAGARGSGSSDARSRDMTARVLELPAGQWLTGGAGAAVAVAGAVIGVRAVQRTYHKHLKLSAMPPGARKAVDVLGVVGGACRGAVFMVAGAFAVRAATSFDAGEAKGVDGTLRTFAGTAAGPWLLAAVAAGLALFGLFSFAMARWRRV